MKTKKTYKLIIIAFVILLSSSCEVERYKSSKLAGSTPYKSIQDSLKNGWGSWNTQDVLSYSCLPEGVDINLDLIIQSKNTRQSTPDLYFGLDYSDQDLEIRPLASSLLGDYSAIQIKMGNLKVIIEAGSKEKDLVLHIKALELPVETVVVTASTGILWNRPGYVQWLDKDIRAVCPDKDFYIQNHNKNQHYIAVDIQGPYFSIPLEDEIWISAGKRMSLSEAQSILKQKKITFEKSAARFRPELETSWKGIISALGFNTIYDASRDRVVSTVARSWNVERGGYAFFGWDNFFLAYLSALENKDLAYANVIEHLNDRTPEGFIPNASQGNGRQTLDRSQPPVGAMMVKEIYKMYPEKWFLEAVFDKLLTWNRWWMKNRYHDGLLCWGSHEGGNPWHDNNYHNFGGAILETGLDDSPMYFDVPFNSKTNLLEIYDVGLNSLYIEDCESLAEMAKVLNKKKETEELTKRAEKIKSKLSELWSSDKGLYLNKRTDSPEFSEILAPTLFYIWLSRIPSESQTRAMLTRHLLNSEEFWGDYVLPSISKDDPHFGTQKYWKGAIWAPLNFLVYLSLREAGLQNEAALLAQMSEELFRKEWSEHGYVAENYSSLDGKADNPLLNSHRFYTWGALMGIMEFMEEGYLPEYEKSVE